MGVYNATVITNAGQNLIASAIAGGDSVNFTALKTSTHVYPAGTALQNLTALSDVKQSVAPTSVDVYNNNIVQISARVPNTGIATAYLINTIGLFGNAGGAETLIAVLTAQTPDEVPVFDAESPAAFIFNIQMTIQNADEVVFEVNDTGTATVADLNRIAQPFTGATASAAGSVGRVPAPAAGDDGKFLRGDATWTAPADMVEAFTSSDVADGGATAWTGVNPLTSGETNKSIFAKLSQMFKNIRYLYKMLGTTDISNIGKGTVTNALSVLNANNIWIASNAYIGNVHFILPKNANEYELESYVIKNNAGVKVMNAFSIRFTKNIVERMIGDNIDHAMLRVGNYAAADGNGSCAYNIGNDFSCFLSSFYLNGTNQTDSAITILRYRGT